MWFQLDIETRLGAPFPSVTGNDHPWLEADIAARILDKAMGYPKSGTLTVLERGTASGAVWLRCPDRLWGTVQAYLSAAELLTATGTMPTGYALLTGVPRCQPDPRRRNLLVIGDSITQGSGMDTSYPALAIGATVAAPWNDATDRERVGNGWKLIHLGNGGSRAGSGLAESNMDDDHNSIKAAIYQAFNLTANDTILIALGANDMVDGSGADGAEIWARIASLITSLRGWHPAVRIIVATIIRRTEDAGNRTRAMDCNAAMLAGYVAAGADAVFRADLAHAAFSPDTGDTTHAIYNVDGIHPNALGDAALATALAGMI